MLLGKVKNNVFVATYVSQGCIERISCSSTKGRWEGMGQNFVLKKSCCDIGGSCHNANMMS